MEKQLLESRRKYVISRINDITKLSNINVYLVAELRSLIKEHDDLEDKIKTLKGPVNRPNRVMRYPHEFAKEKMSRLN